MGSVRKPAGGKTQNRRAGGSKKRSASAKAHLASRLDPSFITQKKRDVRAKKSKRDQ